MSLGENIKLFRKLRGLTQERLSKKANLSRSYLADVERDRYNPSVDTLQAIARALSVGVNDLLGPSIEASSSVQSIKDASENTYDYKKDQSIPPAVKDLLDKLSSYLPEEQERIIKLINSLFELLKRIVLCVQGFTLTNEHLWSRPTIS